MATALTGGGIGPITGPPILSGEGSPEGVYTAQVGALYRRLDGGASTCLYIKESGVEDIGWVPYGAPPALPVPAAGTIVQTVYEEVTSEIIISATHGPPWTNTTGTQFISASITPLYSNSKILIRSRGMVQQFSSPVVVGRASYILFVSGTTTPLAAHSIMSYGDGYPISGFTVEKMHTPGAGIHTYSMRAVNAIAPTISYSLYINGYTYVADGYYPITTLVLQEIKQ